MCLDKPLRFCKTQFVTHSFYAWNCGGELCRIYPSNLAVEEGGSPTPACPVTIASIQDLQESDVNYS